MKSSKDRAVEQFVAHGADDLCTADGVRGRVPADGVDDLLDDVDGAEVEYTSGGDAVVSFD